jgi:subtilisin family serine protease
MYKQTTLRWSGKLFLIGVFLTMLLAGVPVQRANAGSPAGTFIPSQVVVKLNPVSGATIDQINATFGTTTLKPLSALTGVYLLQTPPGKDARDVAEAMAVDLRLKYAELNFVGNAPEADPSNIQDWGGFDPGPYSNTYAATLLNLARAHALSRGQGAVVAVLDTGVQLNHPVLVNSLTTARFDFVGNDAVPEDEFTGLKPNGFSPIDLAAGHGTHVAGIVHLVAPLARIMPVRVLAPDGRGNIFSVAEAITFATRNGANVINLSLGTSSESNLLRDVIRYASMQGVVVVAAAGNLNSDVAQYPGADQCAFGVTSIGPSRVKSIFANYGGWVNFAAPGEGIYSTTVNGGFTRWSGTSMATPFISGQAALVHSMAPLLNPQEVGRLIAGTASSIDALNPLFAGRLGVGLPDMGKSLERLQSGTLPTSGQWTIKGSCI